MPPAELRPALPIPDTLETKIWRGIGVSDDTIRQWLEKREADKATVQRQFAGGEWPFAAQEKPTYAELTPLPGQEEPGTLEKVIAPGGLLDASAMALGGFVGVSPLTGRPVEPERRAELSSGRPKPPESIEDLAAREIKRKERARQAVQARPIQKAAERDKANEVFKALPEAEQDAKIDADIAEMDRARRRANEERSVSRQTTDHAEWQRAFNEGLAWMRKRHPEMSDDEIKDSAEFNPQGFLDYKQKHMHFPWERGPYERIAGKSEPDVPAFTPDRKAIKEGVRERLARRKPSYMEDYLKEILSGPEPDVEVLDSNVNASAESGSGGSLEAINRTKSMAAQGKKFVILNRGGVPRPSTEDGAIGLRPGEKFGIMGPNGFELLDERK